ncbi:MAG: DUF5665 domain-containing protein [Candidatus Margulisiibacteriota bacterium]
MEDQQLLEAIENIRRDKKDPWKYIIFTFLNGLAQGLGVAVGMTIFFGLVLYIVSNMISRMIDFPVIGYYFGELGRLIETYSKTMPPVH